MNLSYAKQKRLLHTFTHRHRPANGIRVVEILEDRCVLDSTVVFSEIMYHPPNDTTGGMEWIELQNQLRVDMDISEWRLAGGVEYTFPDGTIVPGRGQLVVAADPNTFNAATGVPAKGPWRGRLSNGGETLQLFNNDDRLMNEVSYEDARNWPSAPDGSGFSLAKSELTTASHIAANWTFSAERGGTPGQINKVEPNTFLTTTLLAESSPATTFVPTDDSLGLDWTGIDFDDTGWLQGNSPVGFDRRTMIQDSIELDIDEPPNGQEPMPMYRVNSSAYVRIPLQINTDLASFSSILLNVRYDDGFVAYINGVEVAHSKAPGRDGNEDPLTWSSTATGLRRSFDILVADPFEITQFRDIIVQGENILAIHGLNRRATDSDWWVSPSIIGQTPVVPKEQVPLAINEIASAGSDDFFVELINTGDQPVNFDQFVITTASDNANRILLDDNIVLQPGEHLAVRQDNFRPSAGELLLLTTADGQELIDAHRIAQRLVGRSNRHDGRWFYPSEQTPDGENMFAWQEDIVINEIMYHAGAKPADHGLPPTLGRESILRFDWDQWVYNASGDGLEHGWDDTHYAFDGEKWFLGQGLIGFETVSLALPIRTELVNPRDNDPPIVTYYFQTTFEMTADQFHNDNEYELVHFVDSGAVFYLNGEELHRFNIPHEFDSQTSARPSVGNATASGPFAIPSELLRVGENLLSAEVHVAGRRPSDIVFGAAINSVRPDSLAIPGSEYAENSEEWIELYNHGTQAVNLTGWELQDAVRFDFPAQTVIAPGEYLVVAKDANALSAKYPDIAIAGSFSGQLSNHDDWIRLFDASDNIADEVHYFEGGRWDETADGGGSSLELRNPAADNFIAEAWAGSNESAKSEWVQHSFRGVSLRDVTNRGPLFNEFIFGLLDAGEFLIDDIVVTQNPSDEAAPVMQNGTFENDTLGETPVRWRLIGNHSGTVIADPTDPDNQVLHVVASGPQAFVHDHVETTFVEGTGIIDGFEYEISFRAKWISGNTQLNSRLYFNRLPTTAILHRPDRTGTPGKPNSQWEENIGPVFSNLMHHPATPKPVEDVTISVEVEDANQVTSVTLHWRIDGELTEPADESEKGKPIWRRVSMVLTQGNTYSASLPPQPEATITHFYVQAEDGNGMLSQFPIGGRESRALYQVEDFVGPRNDIDRIRIIMTDADAREFNSSPNQMSNRFVPITLVHRSNVFHDVKVRKVGSRWIRPNSGYKIQFHPDKAFYGVHDSIRLDLNGLTEIVMKQMVNRAGGGQNTAYDDIAYLVSPRRSHQHEVLLNLARYETIYLNEQFENGSDGTKYELDDVTFPTSPSGGPEGLKRNTDVNTTADIGVNRDFLQQQGDSPEFYRGHLLLKSNRVKDDFSAIVDLAQAIHQDGDALFEASNQIMDVDRWMRHYANQAYLGNWDTYGFGRPKNLRLYLRPADNKFIPLFWDCDLCNFTEGIIKFEEPTSRLDEIRDIPHNLRLYWGHMLDLINRSFNAEYVSRWATHYGELANGQDHGGDETFGGITRSTEQRSERTLEAIEEAIPRVDFQITTENGTEFSDATATIRGKGWIDVRQLRLVGRNESLDAFWPETDVWQVNLPVGLGENTVTLEAIDWHGKIIDTQTVTVFSTDSHPALTDLRVSEVHFNPADASTEELETGFTSSSFEFVELLNIGDRALDLSDVQFVKTDIGGDEQGIEFQFGASQVTQLKPGQRLVVVEDLDGFAARYGNALPVAGQWSGGLANNQETLTLNWVSHTIQQFSYDDAWHPTTDGGGPSLEIIDPTVEDLSLWRKKEGWQPSAHFGGTPGRSSTQIIGDFNDDGFVDNLDIDLLATQIRSETCPAQFDLSDDGLVDRTDLDELVRSILGVRHGDTDLNGIVDKNDFEALARNFGAVGNWSDGDSNGDGEVTFEDFVNLTNNFGVDG